MNPDRERLVHALFEAALESRPEDRDALLDRSCGGDQELRIEVESLLAADARAGSFLESPEWEAEAEAVGDEVDDNLIGETIGRYEILSMIGSGGMGSVYLAVQEDPRRQVAVKVMRRGIASRSALRRFADEAQLLARLRHPAIAAVYEAGTHDDGTGAVPYFAMEYVPEARPITRYVVDGGLSTRQRLDLFHTVCEAVHHGHQKGVIHRDLKPGNILVDGMGNPKVIDFGVARSTDSDVAVTTQTEVGQLIGTVQYMSPEQCRADPHEIDVRSDVYSLGVVLYELLSARLPYDVGRLPVLAAAQVVCEEQPTRPSTIEPALKGEIETIVLKALEKDRAQRYQSALEFAQDVDRYLKGEAISAQPPSMSYRLRVFVRRNRTLVGALAALFVTLVLGMVGTTMGLIAANQQRDAAEVAQEDAERQATVALMTRDFLEDMLRAIDPEEAGGREVTVRTILDSAAEELEGGALADVPEAEASVRATLGLTYMGLGLYELAEPQLRSALELCRSTQGDEHPDVPLLLDQLAALLERQGLSAEAESMAREALRIRRQVFGDQHGRTLATIPGVIFSLHRQKKLAEARPFIEEALEGFGHLLTDAGSPWYERVRNQFPDAAAYQQVRPEKHPRAVQSMNKLLEALELYDFLAKEEPEYRQELLAEAEPTYREVLAASAAALGALHRETLNAKQNLIYLLYIRGDLAGAERLERQLVAELQSVLGADDPLTLRNMMHLGTQLHEQGKIAEAEAQYRKTVDAVVRLAEQSDPPLLFFMNGLLMTMRDHEVYGDIERLAQAAIEAGRRVLGEYHPIVNNMRAELASELFRQQRWPESETAWRQTLEGYQNALSHEPWAVWGCMNVLAKLLALRGEDAEAESLFLQAVETAAAIESRPWVLGWAKANYALFLMNRQRFEEAEIQMLEAYALAKKNPFGPSASRRAIDQMIKLYTAWGKPEKAAEYQALIEGSGEPGPD